MTDTRPAWPSDLAVFDLAKPLVKLFEGLRLAPYADIAGVATIAWGSTSYPDGRRVLLTDRAIDSTFAEVCLTSALGRFRVALQALVRSSPTAHQAAALLCLAYNIGVANLASSTLLAKFNEGAIDEAADQFLAWDKAHIDGVLTVVNGLLRRREAERELFLTRDVA